jgi:peptidoglycan/xylan/chitin deacetylase (PgdA/CDA1 family)
MGNYYQKLLTKNLSPVVKTLGLDMLTKPFYSGKGQILMFHRVIPATGRERIHNHLSLEISPEHLEEIITYFKRSDYDIISLDMLPSWLEDPGNKKKKFVIFTFDDGYKDNLDFAYPVFNKHKTPFTIYVTNSFPDKKAILWWYIIEELVLKNKEINYAFSDFRADLNCSNYIKKEMAFAYLRSVITKFNEENLEAELSGFFNSYGYSTSDYNTEMTLDWKEISDLSDDPLVTIGAHTLNHYNLCNLTDARSFHEISESKRIIEEKTGSKVDHFSYPLGQYGERETESVRKISFLTATTTKTANIFESHLNHLYTLPRISINSLTTEKVLTLQINGFFPAILNKFRKNVF